MWPVRKAYYIVVQPDLEFLEEFLSDLVRKQMWKQIWQKHYLMELLFQKEVKEQKDDVYFLQNFNRHPVKMVLNECYTNLITDEILTGSIETANISMYCDAKK